MRRTLLTVRTFTESLPSRYEAHCGMNVQPDSTGMGEVSKTAWPAGDAAPKCAFCTSLKPLYTDITVIDTLQTMKMFNKLNALNVCDELTFSEYSIQLSCYRRAVCRAGRSSPSVGLFVCSKTKKKRMTQSFPAWYREWPWDTLEVVQFWGWKVKGQGHRVNKYIYHTNIRSITQKTKDPKVLTVGGISYNDMVWGWKTLQYDVGLNSLSADVRSSCCSCLIKYCSQRWNTNRRMIAVETEQ